MMYNYAHRYGDDYPKNKYHHYVNSTIINYYAKVKIEVVLAAITIYILDRMNRFLLTNLFTS